MNDDLLNEWILKAQEDYDSAQVLLKAKKSPGNIGFHCQQAIEKYLKAYLLKNNITPPRKHDLVQLIEQAGKYDKNLVVFKQTAREINPYAVIARYPGEESVSLRDAKAVFAKTKELYKYLQKLF